MLDNTSAAQQCDKVELADRLFTKSPERNDAQAPKAPQAVTYLAQLIAHDIVPPTNRIETDRPVEEISPYLNLDSIYGMGFDALVEDGIADLKGRFRFRVDTSFPFHLGCDFERKVRLDPNGVKQDKANTPEQRNDENIIISQFTVLFMRLHNMLLELGLANNFEKARELVVKTFQLVVIEYVLANVSQSEVFKFFFRTKIRLGTTIELSTGIPKYFSHSSFRFGHSMVRHEYLIARRLNNTFVRKSGRQIFKKHQLLDTKDFLDFDVFIGDVNNASQRPVFKSRRVDTNIVSGMSNIGQRNRNGVNIARRNIDASYSDLESGNQIHRRLIETQVNLPDALNFDQPLSLAELQITGLPDHCLPDLSLWLYILAEAEIRESGYTLGKVGSFLNLKVLHGAISGCKISVFDNGKYEFDDAINAMGQWGQEIKGQDVNSDNAAHTLMITIYKLLKLGEQK